MGEAPLKNTDVPKRLEDIFDPIQLTLLGQISTLAQFVIKPMSEKMAQEAGGDFATDTVRRIIYFNTVKLEAIPMYRTFAVFAHELVKEVSGRE